MAYVFRGNLELTGEMKKENQRRKTIAIQLGPDAQPIDGRSNFFGVSAFEKYKFQVLAPLTLFFQSLL